MGNCFSVATNPLVQRMDFAEAVTLVVGNDTECKTRVAEALAEARGALDLEVTKAGVRVFTRESAPTLPVVIDTVPLSTAEGSKPVDTARAWISRNGLRKLGGRLVFVVCVIASIDPQDKIFEKPDFAWKRLSWLQLLACVFEHHLQKIMFVVDSDEGSEEKNSSDGADSSSSRKRPRLRDILHRDGFHGRDGTIFFSCNGGLITPTVNTVLQYSVHRDHDDDESSRASAGPFYLPFVRKGAGTKDRFGPWGPENILLFGRSGCGKSTLAQMLTSGRLDAHRKSLTVSSSIRGVTTAVNSAYGRGWCVVDTPGFGESAFDQKSSVPTARARDLIKSHVQLVEGTYAHLFYVWKKGRVEDLDVRLWKEFKKAFEAEGIQSPLTFVVSDADQEWLDENISTLRTSFEGCESFVTADFPMPGKDDDYAIEKESQEVRLESLKELEDELARLHRTDTSTKVGRWSRGTQLREWKRLEHDYTTPRPAIRQSPAFGPSAADPQPSDYDAARLYIRMKNLKTTISSAIRVQSDS